MKLKLCSRLSTTLTILLGVASGIGLALGALSAVSSATKVVEHRPEDNAVLPHVVIGLLVLGFIIGAMISTRSMRWFWWPIDASVGERFGRTFRSSRNSFSGLLRSVGAVILQAFMALLVFRMGFQATAGMASSFSVNAWGGPSAFGAFMAHGVDAVVCLIVACLALDRVLVPTNPSVRTDAGQGAGRPG
ncbi:hypothetical protein [Gordonia liuliyuniae]|uniref:DUF2975 domain-containing protein n=1 Tax=Gordonia liuliyuniae TaxID=2911517 RepID=A0ABS9ITH7_9ACTN|nr:hypothetical protein [Gordonia liuliyuniae]MCF8588859.1 hypothetical protein [Gordonia liuliyuniae]